ncbi:hypothetical protein Ancab_036478 [Ancistrocladus abbreviatus]
MVRRRANLLESLKESSDRMEILHQGGLRLKAAAMKLLTSVWQSSTDIGDWEELTKQEQVKKGGFEKASLVEWFAIVWSIWLERNKVVSTEKSSQKNEFLIKSKLDGIFGYLVEEDRFLPSLFGVLTVTRGARDIKPVLVLVMGLIGYGLSFGAVVSQLGSGD